MRGGRASSQTAGKAWLDGARQPAAGRRLILLGAVTTIVACGQAWCLAVLLAAAIGRGDAQVLPWAAGFLALALLRAGLGIVSERGAARLGAAARRTLRSGVLTRMLAAGPDALRHRPAGAVATLAVDTIEQLDGLFARWSPAAALALISPAIVLMAAALADPGVVPILAGAGLLVPVGMALAGIGAAAAARRQFAAMAQLQVRFLDRLRGIATIVLAGRAADEAVRLRQAADELALRTLRVLRVAFLSSVALDGAAALALILLAWRYANRAGPASVAIFALLLAVEFFAPLRAFSAAYQDRLTAAAATDAFDQSPSPAPVIPASPRMVDAQDRGNRGVTVAFEGVRYAWTPDGPPTIDGLSFRVTPGETLLLVGPSGAGKSTIIELLLGFVRPTQGQVTLNGTDVASLGPAALAQMTSWIGQRPMLFAGTIEDNIRFGRPDASAAALDAAVQAAGVATFAVHLPDGLATRVGEGGYGLSGGQAQRVAVARAYLRDAPLLLLDEPTAHLDPTTEADLFASLAQLATGRTVILASHSAAADRFAGRRLELMQVLAQGAA